MDQNRRVTPTLCNFSNTCPKTPKPVLNYLQEIMNFLSILPALKVLYHVLYHGRDTGVIPRDLKYRKVANTINNKNASEVPGIFVYYVVV